uniref:Uncharacterized protein n=1 Tax=Caenorhabditis japonica TaxID=281687 RepID=A0A8R1EU50_CAEJA
MKKVLAEALNVQNVSLLDSISDKDANNIVQALKTYASLADQKLARTNEITLILKAPALRSDYDPPENTTISLTRKRMENDTTLLKPSAAEVKQNILHELLSESYGFFSVLFAKYVAYENDGIFWKAVVWIAVMLLACACGPVIYWFRTVIDEVREKSRN